MVISSLESTILLATAFLVATAPCAVSQTPYPSRAVKVVVPLPPGPTADILPRVLAERLAARWRQPVIIENRPGAALNLGAEVVARSEPDGHTLLATPSTPLVISQHFNPKLAFDPAAFVPITVFAEAPYVLVANPKVPATTLQELITFAKANPDKLNFGSGGPGSAPHLTVEMLKFAASIHMVHVPYTGLGPAMTNLLAGHVDLLVDNLGNVLSHITEGRLKALAVTSEARISELPSVPAVTELLPGFYSTSWFALVAPPKTPPDIALTISVAVVETLREAQVAKRFHDLSFKPVGKSPAETAAFLKEETERWRKIIVASGLRQK